MTVDRSRPKSVKDESTGVGVSPPDGEGQVGRRTGTGPVRKTQEEGRGEDPVGYEGQEVYCGVYTGGGRGRGQSLIPL